MRHNPNKLHKCNASQGPFELIKTLNTIRREIYICTFRRTSQRPNVVTVWMQGPLRVIWMTEMKHNTS